LPLRWTIAALLFASTVINYIDRQTLSVLAPYLKTEFQWSNTDFAMIVVAFRVAYAIGQTASGRLLDRLGARAGLMLMVTFYSFIAMATSLASGLRSFAAFRFLLGAGESANWPGAAKTVSEWFPKQERGWAVAFYDSGSAIGGAIAPVLVLWLYATFHSWRPAFVITGALGLAWVVVWARICPKTAPPNPDAPAPERERPSLRSVLRLRSTWAIVLGRSLTDPVWFFISDWFAVYLVSKGFALENTIAGFWVPFLAADFGNFAGGGFSSWLIRRGWPVTRARELVFVVGGIGMTLLAVTVFTQSFPLIITLFAIATFCYAANSTMVLTLPADLYESRAVATVSGLSGTGAGIGTICSTFLVGYVADHWSFEPVLVAASIIPVMAIAVFLLLLRTKSPL